MTSKVNDNLNHYFELWLKCNCSWGQVMIHEERTNNRSTSEEQYYEWMYGFDVNSEFPKRAAEGWIAAMKNGETRYVADAM